MSLAHFRDRAGKTHSICPRFRNDCLPCSPHSMNKRALRIHPCRWRLDRFGKNKTCFPHREHIPHPSSRDFCTDCPRDKPYRRHTRIRNIYLCRRAKNRRNISLRTTRCRPLCTVRIDTAANSSRCPVHILVFLPYSYKYRIRLRRNCPDNRIFPPQRRVCTNTSWHHTAAPPNTTTFPNKRNRLCRRRLSPPNSRIFHRRRIFHIRRHHRIYCRPDTKSRCICRLRHAR